MFRSRSGIALQWSIVLCCVVSSAVAFADWPGFRGRGDSVVREPFPPVAWELRSRAPGSWNIRLPGYGQSSPVVWKDQVYVTAVSGNDKEHLHLAAISTQDGAIRWQRDFAATQRVKDSDTVSRGAPTPVCDESGVYAVFESGDVVALSHAGDVRWERSFVKDHGEIRGPHGYASSPVLSEGLMVLQVAHAGPSYLLALKAVDGTTAWKTDHPSQTGWSTPLVVTEDGQAALVVSTSGSARCVRLRDGEELWTVQGLSGNSTASPAAWRDCVLIASGGEREGGPRGRGAGGRPAESGSADGRPGEKPSEAPAPPGGPARAGSVLIRLGGRGDVSGTHVVWNAPKVNAGYASPVVVGDLAWFVNRVGGVQCVDLATGEVRYQHRLPGQAWASPVAAGEHIVFFCKDGAVVSLKASDAVEECGESSLSATDVVYGVAADEGAWLIRTGRGLVRVTHPPATAANP